jgi:O-antigen ligase
VTLAGLALVVVALFYTYSRGPLIALGAGAMLLLFRGRRVVGMRPEIVATAIAAYWFIHSSLGNAAVAGRLGSSATVEIRLALYRMAWNLFKQNPVFGLGIRGFGHAASSMLPAVLSGQPWSAVDNYYLQTLVEGGLVGAIVLAVLLGLSLRSFRSPLGGALTAAILILCMDFDALSFPVIASVLFLAVKLGDGVDDGVTSS